jgi:CelD/BcsL family acetyltransferase involved in cellulose biosynthesis
MNLTTRLLGSTERRAAAAAWTELVAAGARDGVAASWEWTSTWLEHFGEVVPHRFALVERAGEPAGAALICGPVRRRRAGVPLRTLLVGTAGEPAGERVHVEHNRVLARPGEERAVAGALLAALRGAGGWDELLLPGFAPADAAHWDAAVQRVSWTAEPSPVCELEAAGDDGVLGLLSAGVRRRVRQSMRAYGELETGCARTPADARDVLDELIELHGRRWASAGAPGAFASARLVGFHRALAEAWADSGRVRLFRVRAGGDTIACLYGMVEDGRLLFYQSGLRAETDNRLRPGLVAHVLCMEACRRDGLREYDFLAGDSRYKRELSTAVRELLWGTVQRPGPRQALRAGMHAGRSLARAARSREA